MLGRPEGWNGPASRMLDDPAYWIENLSKGNPRIQFCFEARIKTGGSRNAGYTGLMVPCSNEDDVCENELRVHDVPYGALSSRAAQSMFDPYDWEMLQQQNEADRRVTHTSWREAAQWSCWQMINDVSMFTKIHPFPLDSSFDDRGYLLSGQTELSVEKRFYRNWR